ncbi:hypothetical protein MUK71_08870 [Arthrobacter zhangbolii]|uniref:Uncharacterized protein n=1 Tax=Arthrobacter zhangbolii TaxID=2886936 RepID=A0A9X1S841_9MICC|nr:MULTISPECIES: hypothetical protein [Arthrobacter]MCC3271468.1 hypothetical protein [Arthrobacter zhangbolii]MCC3293377.1 hypothetical protein [Arthrobacter zhangbolii]MDN3904539.1 hypothetical protein [Arthrobacter sp. YD2]UON90760.1 hypothetical protein MUK71_08870 [Arthrobacter zhangbolii]
MPWWSWILIWLALAAGAAAFYALIGYRLFQRFLGILREFETASAKLSFSVPETVSSTVVEEGGGGIFMEPATARTSYEAGKAARRDARRQRRIERRTAKGQPRAWRDLPDL